MKKFLLTFLFIIFSLSLFAKEVKVLILEDKTKFSLQASAGFRIVDLDTNKTYKLEQGGTFKVSLKGDKVYCGNLKSKNGFRLSLLDPKNNFFTIEKNKYNGNFEILPNKETLNLIEVLDLEKYLLGVLPYEMSYSWEIEALKAQAVAGRTYTLNAIEHKKKNIPFDLYSDVRSQMYKGSAVVYDSVKEAVESTKGEVLRYDGKLFKTYYHANCGGHTDAFPGDKEPIKPLSGAKDNSCGWSKSSKWTATLSTSKINDFLSKNKIGGKIRKIKIGKKYSSGRAKTLELITTKTTKEVSCNDFRIAVGSVLMRSCFITDISGLELSGKGFGHGAGMCQDGAKGMAKEGKTYKQILSRFYPSAEIEQI